MRSYKKSKCRSCGGKFEQRITTYFLTCSPACLSAYHSKLKTGMKYGLQERTKQKMINEENVRGLHRKVISGTGDHEGDLV